jgi:hypothetical protein
MVNLNVLQIGSFAVAQNNKKEQVSVFGWKYRKNHFESMEL